ncbi:MAG TPA: hypothetical protein VFS43_23985 [Polyangiaceae bacterium]|nr:hypothetical protein [Polyangiaceae bacterium]
MPSLSGPCPRCGAPAMRVLYAGLPARFCSDEACNCMWGPGEWAARAFGFNGVLFPYEGSYLAALWAWLRAPLELGP